MSNALIIQVRLHDGRYHGEGDWPPCPARLFQALVAAAGLNGTLASMHDSLDWLQKQSAPIVGAPRARRVPHLERVMFYMPNNDLDAVQGDPRRMAEIRSATKIFQPYLFDANVPFLYAWVGIANEDKHHAENIRSLADFIYQLGRGIDMAWAWADVFDSGQAEIQLAEYRGKIFRPSGGGRLGTTLLCPQNGSLDSLDRRHAAYSKRFTFADKSITFRKAPRANFKRVSYDSPANFLLYDLRSPDDAAEFVAWPLTRIGELVVALRDAAMQRLERALPDQKAEIARILIGRKPDGTNDGPTTERVRIIPLPSIGHYHADRAIRRILIEVPSGCPFCAEDVSWAFSGLAMPDSPPSESISFVLTPAGDEGMLRHYGINEDTGARMFRTVTPAALPEAGRRRRIEPTRKAADAKTGAERVKEVRRAADAVGRALRHVGIRTPVDTIRLQPEPFDSKGDNAEAFASGTRFSKHQLWHVEITFAAPYRGPLIVGDGRFCGLGLMVPVC
jgi:CRISPR-associated protein Csb2